ncbi:hypothetical protein HanRHA438_Chr07g0299451 [Helianthus annuus]|nr:hypothetical protein HanRHA438_Chr07g0299451 [Helianthus annuus]
MQPRRKRRGVLWTELNCFITMAYKLYFIYKQRCYIVLEREYGNQNIIKLVQTSFLGSKARVRPRIMIIVLWNSS